MTKRLRLLAFCAAGLLAASTASAVPQHCDVECTWNSACSTPCWNGWTTTTCNAWGICNFPPSPPACYSFTNEGYGEAFGLYPYPCYVGYRQLAMGSAIADYERHNGQGSWDDSCDKEIGPQMCTCTQTGYQTKWNCVVRARPPYPN